MAKQIITFSAPGKVHLLGEHAVVYGKPALLTTVNLRVTVTLKPKTYNDAIVHMYGKIKEVVEPIIKKYLKIRTIPPYQINIDPQIPLGCGLGSSAATSAAYIAALLTFLKTKWDLNLVNKLAFEAEKAFHGNPSGADNSTVVLGGLVWYRKEVYNLKLITQLPFSIPNKLAKNFMLINTGKPKETTKDMVQLVKNLNQKNPAILRKFLEKQELLTKELLEALEHKNEKRLISIIKMGENNLENIGVVSKSTALIIREIESSYGAAKICGGGGKKGPTGILLCYHPAPKILEKIAKSHTLDYYKVTLGAEGLRRET